jgi:hypothetical protein
MKGSERAGNTSDEDKAKGTGQRASLYTNQHGQFGLDILESRTLEGSERARYTSDGDKLKGTGQRASLYTN